MSRDGATGVTQEGPVGSLGKTGQQWAPEKCSYFHPGKAASTDSMRQGCGCRRRGRGGLGALGEKGAPP